MRFKDISGHEDVKERLRAMVDNDMLPHALLLYGGTGTGKLMLARALAAYLHCTNRTPDGDSCGQCPACRQHAAHNHVDTHYSFPTLKKKSDDKGESADFYPQWKEFLDEDPYADLRNWLGKLDKPNGQPVIYTGEAEALSRRLSYTSRSSQYKVAIIWLPERFQPTAANKLLKLIEEPFPDTKLIFVSNDARSILPTIYSRLQRVEVPRLDEADVSAVLMKQFKNVDAERAADAARAAAGDVTVAREMIQGGSNDEMLRLFIALMRYAFQRKIVELRKWSEEVAKMGREVQMHFLDYCCRMLRENFMNNTGLPGITRMTANERGFSEKFSRFINSSNVLKLMSEFEQAKVDIASNGNAKIIFFDVAIHVILLIKTQ